MSRESSEIFWRAQETNLKSVTIAEPYAQPVDPGYGSIYDSRLHAWKEIETAPDPLSQIARAIVANAKDYRHYGHEVYWMGNARNAHRLITTTLQYEDAYEVEPRAPVALSVKMASAMTEGEWRAENARRKIQQDSICDLDSDRAELAADGVALGADGQYTVGAHVDAEKRSGLTQWFAKHFMSGERAWQLMEPAEGKAACNKWMREHGRVADLLPRAAMNPLPSYSPWVQHPDSGLAMSHVMNAHLSVVHDTGAWTSKGDERFMFQRNGHYDKLSPEGDYSMLDYLYAHLKPFSQAEVDEVEARALERSNAASKKRSDDIDRANSEARALLEDNFRRMGMELPSTGTRRYRDRDD